MPSPAELLAADKARQKRPAAPRRPTAWVCLVRERRERLNLSLRDVADAVDLSTAGLINIENGSDTMLTTASRIAEFFGVTMYDLWPSQTEVTDDSNDSPQ